MTAMPRRSRKQQVPEEPPAWSVRLDAAMTTNSWSAKFLAARMGREGDEALIGLIYKYRKGKVKHPRGDLLEKMAGALNMSEVELRYGPDAITDMPSNVHPLGRGVWVIKIVGEVAAGVWRDVGMADQAGPEDQQVSGVPADPRFPASAQYDLVVRGTSIDKTARDGDIIRVVRVADVGYAPTDGDLVVVQRTRFSGQIVETTAKRLRIRRDSMELWPESSDERWQEPIPYGGAAEGEMVEIIGLALYAIRPLRK